MPELVLLVNEGVVRLELVPCEVVDVPELVALPPLPLPTIDVLDVPMSTVVPVVSWSIMIVDVPSVRLVVSVIVEEL